MSSLSRSDALWLVVLGQWEMTLPRNFVGCFWMLLVCPDDSKKVVFGLLRFLSKASEMHLDGLRLRLRSRQQESMCPRATWCSLLLVETSVRSSQ